MRTKHIYFAFALGLFSCSQDETKIINNADKESLPYYSDASFTPQWSSNIDLSSTNFHTIPDFSFTNQNGETISNETTDGKIFVVDYFFTTCPGICAKMTKNMGPVQLEFMNDDDVLILSHSVTPEKDSVQMLRNYATANNINSKKWHLLTGDKKTLYDLGRQAYFIEESQGLEKTEDEFLHTENFVLIDQNRHIRGIYNGLSKSSVEQLIEDIHTLQKEK